MNKKIVYAWYHNGEIFYVGIGNIRRRHKITGRNQHCLNKRAKAKREGTFKISILFENLSWNQACKIEQELISEYGRRDNNTGILTNMTDGGEGRQGGKHSKETKEKISASKRGCNNPQYGKPLTFETKKKISVANSGENNPLFGKLHDKESKKKMSKSKIGKNNYRSKPVMTPLGKFDSMCIAAKELKCKDETVSNRAKSDKFPEYYFIQ